MINVRVISCEFVDRLTFREEQSTKSHELKPTNLDAPVDTR